MSASDFIRRHLWEQQHLFIETDGVAHLATNLHASFLCHSLSDSDCCHSSRLRNADPASASKPAFQKVLCNLCKISQLGNFVNNIETNDRQEL
jgi:hypothetical protein